jgi:hypothetical protein
MLLVFNFVNANELKQSKDTNKTMSNEEFMKEFTRLNKKSEETKKLEKTVDEIINKLGVKK